MNQYYPLTEEEIKLAEKIARKYTRKSAWSLVSFDDAFSHLKLWLYSNTDIVISCREADEFAKLTEKYLYTCLRNEVNKFCAKETKAVVNRDLSDGNRYTVYSLTQALPIYFKLNHTELEMNSDSSSLAYNVTADITSALYGLPEADVEVIELRYKLGYSGESLAKELGIEVNAASQRVHRALEKLVSKLSGSPMFDDDKPKHIEL